MKRFFVVLILLFLVPNLGSHVQDNDFFVNFTAPDVLLILDTSASMNYNMYGDIPTGGDGTIGGNTTHNGYEVQNPFRGYSEEWGPQSGSYPWVTGNFAVNLPATSGDFSRMHLVKEAITAALNRYGGKIRWALAGFHQVHPEDQVSSSWGPTGWYRAWYKDRFDNWNYYTPEVDWVGDRTTYANQQFKLWVNMSEGGGSSHVNEILRHINSYVGDIDGETDSVELRSTCYTPIAPALRGARYWYAKDEIKNSSVEERKCRKYFIVLLTDGEPTVGIEDQMTYINQTYDHDETALLSSPAPNVSNPPEWMKDQAVAEAESLRNTRCISADESDTTFVDIRTFVVGMGPAADLQETMNRIAEAGGTEEYYPATDTNEIKEQLGRIFDMIIAEAYSFSAGEVTSIQEDFLSTGYEARIYLASFFPFQNENPFWEGHLRALTVELGGLSLDDIPPERIIWDAGDLLRSKNPSERTVYGICNDGTYDYMWPFDNSNFTSSDLGVMTDGARDTVINLVRSGSSVSDTVSYLGDVFHSAPLRIGSPTYFYRDDGFVQYRDSISSRTPAIYVGSNTGMLHAFNDLTGEELFAVVPKNFVPEVKALRDSHRFYVDADPMAADIWFPDGAADEYKDRDEWRTVLMACQGEGGSGITCLDVTNPNYPLHLFSFEHDTMGLTTSVPIMYKVGRILVTEPVERFLAFFGGGECPDSLWNRYDPTSTGTLRGNVIVALDVESAEGGLAYGSNYWFIKPVSGDANKMVYPFASAGSMINLNPRQDNRYDLLYIPDLAGQLWKVNVSNPDTATWRAQCIFRPPIPTAANEDAPGNNKKPSQPAFFAPLIEREPATGCLWLFYGTGDRSKIFKDNTDNRFYAILDTIADTVDFYPMSETNLKRAWADGPYEFPGEYPTYRGWYIVFSDSGHVAEKVVTQATLLMDTLMFGTFEESEDADECNPGGGFAREYTFHFRTGSGHNRVVGSGIPQAPRYSFGDEIGYEIHQTFDSLWIQQTTSYGTLKRVLQWKER